MLLLCGAALLQQSAGQRHVYRGSHETGRQGCNHGGHREGQHREEAADDRIHFGKHDEETYQAADRKDGQRDPVPRNDMENEDPIPDITLVNRNFIFAPAFNTPIPCPPGSVRLTKTGPCRGTVRDLAPRGPVRPERGVCPSGMVKVGQWCREPYG